MELTDPAKLKAQKTYDAAKDLSQNIFERKRAMSRVRGTQVVTTSARPAK